MSMDYNPVNPMIRFLLEAVEEFAKKEKSGPGVFKKDEPVYENAGQEQQPLPQADVYREGFSRQIELDEEDKPIVLTISDREMGLLADASKRALSGDINGLIQTIQLVTRYTQAGKAIPLVMGKVELPAGPPGPQGPMGSSGPPGPSGTLVNPGPRNGWSNWTPFIVRTEAACGYSHGTILKDPSPDMRQSYDNEKEFRHQIAAILQEILITMNAHGMPVNEPNFYCYSR